jgi:hypothetical protein
MYLNEFTMCFFFQKADSPEHSRPLPPMQKRTYFPTPI